MLKFRELKETANYQFMNQLHKKYLDRIKFYGEKIDLTRFSWDENKKIILYGIEVYYDDSADHKGMLVFAMPAKDKNKILYTNAIKETKNLDFISMHADIQRFEWLINHKFLSSKLQSKVIISSVNLIFGNFTSYNDVVLEIWSKEWVHNEYESTLKAESHPTSVTKFPKTNQRFFIDRYHFKDMLNTINDSQFTDEFNQCLFAYENDKWFLCATGLGSCLEHLMYIILANYSKTYSNNKILTALGKEPTASDFSKAFMKKPISISVRQQTFFRALFLIRNSVDHHNTGSTQKEMCDLLLNGISDTYNDYYRSSIDKNYSPNRK